MRQFPEFLRALCSSPDGEWIAVADASGQISVMDAGDGKIHHQWSLHDQPAEDLRWPRQDRLVSIGEDGCARIVNPRQGGSEVATVESDQLWIEGLAVCPVTERIAICAGRRASVWTLNGEKTYETRGHESTVAGVNFLPGTGSLLTACYGAIYLWDTADESGHQNLEWKGSLFTPHPSPDGEYIACGCQDDTVHFWRTATGDDSQMAGFPGKPKLLSWSADSSLLATCAAHVALVWNFSGAGPEGTTPSVMQANEFPISAAAFHPQKPLLLTGAEDGALMVWAPQDGEVPQSLSVLPASISAVKWMPDHRHFIAGDAEGYVGSFQALK